MMRTATDQTVIRAANRVAANLEREIERLRASLTLIAKRVDDMPARTRNDYEAGEKNAYQWCADNALAALED